MKRKLPIGIQSFRKLREDGYLYVDKTKGLHKLATEGNYYFLARPRRFGKSLMLSTLKEIYQGSKELFKELWIENNWNWNETNPIIHISFSSIGYKTSSLENAINTMLEELAEENDIQLTTTGHDQRFKELLVKLSAKNKVVLLIDEYDKPIIDYLDDLDQAKENQGILKAFYSIIKDSDPYIELLMITGVSKFSKVSIFSELNNLIDITIHPKFSTLVGITQQELEECFQKEITELAIEHSFSKNAFLDLLKKWYNGYSWDGKNFLYNPFSLLSFFSAGQFHNFWFSTGTPTFLIKLLKDRMAFNFERMEVGQVAFDSYDIEKLETVSLLFQTGYLTIKEVEPFGLYILDYPNQEVKDNMLQYLIGAFSYGSHTSSTPIVLRLRKAFIQNDLDLVVAIINSLFKSIPANIFIKNKEAYYHSVVFLVFQYLGLFIEAEVHTSDGRMDAIIKNKNHIYILEFKLDYSAKEALEQIGEKGYAEKYQGENKQIVGIGINFSSATKSIEGWETKQF